MTTPMQGLQYLVAFNNGPLDDPALITTVADRTGALGAANVWTDISRFVNPDSGGRGRQQEFRAFEAATRELQLDNSDGRFTPWNTTSPYTGLVNPRKLVQVRVTWNGITYTRFTGHANAWDVGWPNGTRQTVNLRVADAFRLFNGWDVTSTGYPAQVIADGATGYWRLGDPAGATKAYDTATATYDGVYNGTFTLGNPGAMPVDPTSSANFMPTGSATTGSVTLPAVGGPYSVSSNVSVEAWVASPSWTDIPGLAAGNYVFIMTNAAGAAIWLFVNTAGNVEFVIQDGSGNKKFALSTTVLPADSSWHHVIAAYNGSTVAIYIDGVSVAGATTTSGVIGSWTPTFGGVAGDVTPDGPLWAGGLQEVAFYTATCLSAGQAANHYALGALPQQSTDARIGRVLTAIGWSAGARNLDTGTSTVQAVTSTLTSTSSLGHMQQVEATEASALFMTGDGKVRFLSRSALFSNSLYTTSQATLGDNTAGGDIPFLPGPKVGRDDIFIYNVASAQRAGGNLQTTTDPTAAINGPSTWSSPSTLIGVSDVEVLELTQYVVAKYAAPTDRITSVTVDLAATAASFPSLVPTILSLDLMQRVTVERTVMPAGGTAFTQQCNIEHIAETINPNQWFITFQLAVADPIFWVLGTGQLGITTRLAF